MREVHCQDALSWLAENAPVQNSSLVASLPDWSEFPNLSLEVWKDWFRDAARAVLRGCPEQGVSIFHQSDIKVEGTWVDKGFLCQQAAEDLGHRLIWHKVVCRIQPGQVTRGRPSWSHLLCFSKEHRARPEFSLMDVIPDPGEKTWIRGMGLNVCRLICRYIRDETPTRTLVAPFCGHGLVLAVAEDMGLKPIGIELSAKRARKAKTIFVPGGG